jgi:hypothetical protein
MNILTAILVTVTMAAVDYCHANYNGAMMARRTVQAAFWSVGQWAAAAVGFVVAVKISMWYLPFEALGLFVGTLLGARRVNRLHVSRTRQSEVPGVPENGSGSS